MVKNILNYLFGSQKLRIVLDEKENPWFIAKDIAEILEYSDSQAMTRKLDDDEVGTCTDNSSGQGRNMVIISESGLYSCILTSEKEQAKPFKRWVTSVILPSIRKKGYYSVKDISKLIEEENQKYEKQLETINTDINKYFISLSNIPEFREYNSLLSQKKGIVDMITENNKAIKINARHKNKILTLDT